MTSISEITDPALEGLASFPSPGPLSSKCLGRLVQLAATIIGAEGSFLLLNIDGVLTLGLPSGMSWQSVSPSRELLDRCLASSNASIERSVTLHKTAAGGLLATVVLGTEGFVFGIAGVCDHFPVSLSAAQELAFLAVPVEITETLHCEFVSRGTEPGTLDMIGRLRMLESVVVNANDSVLITAAEPIESPGPIIQYVNPAFTRTTGYALEEVLGKSPRLLQGPLSGRTGPDRIRAALKEWKPVEVELLNYRKDGSTFWVELSISPVCDEKGWYTHWISVQRDVTERKKNEEIVALMRSTNLQNEALMQEIRERKLIEAKLSHVAFHDDLTGVRNRSFLMEALKTSLDRAQSRPDYKAAVIYIDLDGFKAVNDAFGHSFGDLLLIEISRRIRACARLQDTVARLGGDEFILLIDDQQSAGDALEVGNRLREAIHQPVHLSGNILTVTASVGISQVNRSYSESENVLRDADIAMYRAKRNGNVGCVLFDESMHEKSVADLQLKVQLNAALERDEFELFYQPLVDLRDRSVRGVEALIRWNHPERGMLSPGEFIAQAEEMGLIVEIGLWVLRRACTDFRLLLDASPTAIHLNVNVSSRQLDDPEFLGDLIRAIEESAIDPALLQLEITESVFLKNAELAGMLFRQIRELGVKIAFDDFGTGYSSLSYVDKYPIDILKIDQSFVQKMCGSTVNANIVQMVIRLARAAGMSVSAEGVETEEQAVLLQKYGCTLAQGYLFSRPQPLHIILSMLAEAGW
jgi:diguanylate cyclase (GGDEF)-like protein/PAS domain S-box-containing protein